MTKHSGVLGALALLLTLGMPAAALAQVDFGSLGGDAPADESEGPSNDSGDRRLYVAPMASWTKADDDRGTDDGLGFNINVGKRVTSGLNLELSGQMTRLDGDDEKAELSGLGVAAMIFPSQSLPNLYAVVGLYHGQGEKHPTNAPGVQSDYRTTLFEPGIGWLQPLGDWLGYEIAVRAEARYRMDAHNDSELGQGPSKEFYEGVANVGVQIPLGKLPVQEAPAEEVAVVEPQVTDTDGDGVPDDQDQCPDTPAGTAVNAQGCEGDTDGDGVVDRLDTCPETAAGAAVDEKGCPADADGDGVTDDMDQCPDTAPGTAVDEKGCPADADGDGVANDKDQCPDTPAGTEIDENGCPKKGCRAPKPGEPINLEGCATGESIILKGVNFEVNSSRLTANAKVILNQVGDSLAAQPGIKVEIGGHTDSQGSDAFNQKLSERRADSVQTYLVKRGIDSGRLTTKGYGETQPIDSNETPEGRELNRRVEMKVVEGGAAQ